MSENNNINKSESVPSIEEIKERQAREWQAEKDRQIAVYLATKDMPEEESRRVWKQFEEEEKHRDARKRLDWERKQRLKNMHI